VFPGNTPQKRAPETSFSMASIVSRTRDYTEQVAEEIKKVTWPDWPQLKNSTLVVIIFVVIVSLIIFLMDVIVRNVLGFIINLFA
jgi:preprotein translocase subunit SecE